MRRELGSYIAGNIFEDAAKETWTEWALMLVSFYESIDDFADAMNLNLNYNKDIINYCACQTGYNVLFEFENGTVYNLHTLCEMLN